MNRGYSLYLDIVRFAAACLVYLSHSNVPWLVKGGIPASGYAHAAVIVFFVLSGYVIAYVTDVKERVWQDFAAARLSRIYSVAVPAVLLTVLLDAAGRMLYPGIYGYPFDRFAIRIPSSLLFLNEIWFVSITNFSNVPYWSVCYEAWYYVFFAILTFAPKRAGVVACVALALLLGPKIALLAPVWGLGVILYRWERLRFLSDSTAWLLVIGSTVGIVAFQTLGVAARVDAVAMSWLGGERYRSLVWSWHFLSDYMLGVLVFIHLAGVRGLTARVRSVPAVVERPIRFLASYTFSLYLLHQPLLLFWGSVIQGDPGGYRYWAATTICVALSVLGIGYFTEQKRYLLTAWLRDQLRSLGRGAVRHAGAGGG